MRRTAVRPLRLGGSSVSNSPATDVGSSRAFSYIWCFMTTICSRLLALCPQNARSVGDTVDARLGTQTDRSQLSNIPPGGMLRLMTTNHAPAPGHALTAMAISATLHCLTGCAIGEVLGMVIGTALGWHNAATIAVSIALAFVFGYSLTMLPVLRAGLTPKAAVGVALAADTISIAVMEIVDNTVIVAVPGAMDAGLTSWLFWAALGGSLVVAFVVTVPVNRMLIARGRGHAVVHAYH